MEKRDKMFGITTEEIVAYLGKVKWRKEKPSSRYERYVYKALKSLEIPLDTAVVFTEKKTHPFSMAEIAQGEEKVKGKSQTVYGIFVHEFSIGILKAIYKQLLVYIPYLKDDEMEKMIVVFIQKVLLHELGHRAYWRNEPLGIKVDDAEEYSEVFSYIKLAELYDDEFLERFMIYNYAVAQDYILDMKCKKKH